MTRFGMCPSATLVHNGRTYLVMYEVEESYKLDTQGRKISSTRRARSTGRVKVLHSRTKEPFLIGLIAERDELVRRLEALFTDRPPVLLW